MVYICGFPVNWGTAINFPSVMFISQLSQESFSVSFMSKENNSCGVRSASQTHDASVSLEPWASLARLQHLWIPKGSETVYLLQWSSWCLPQRIQQPQAFTGTTVASHLENKSIMCKATASNLPTSPVIPDVATMGQMEVTAFWVMEKSGQICHRRTIRVLHFSSNDHSCFY